MTSRHRMKIGTLRTRTTARGLPRLPNLTRFTSLMRILSYGSPKGCVRGMSGSTLNVS